MKYYKIVLLGLILSGLACACSDSEEGKTLISDDQIIRLTEQQVTNFLNVLPVVLDFSDKYRASLTPSEVASPDYNVKFFKTLRNSKKIEEIVIANQFRSMDDFIHIYKNVILAYYTLKTEITNFEVQIGEISARLKYFKDTKMEELKDPTLPADMKKMVEEQLAQMENDEKIFDNIGLVHRYLSNFDAQGLE